jgi:hypothetical protein
MKTAILFVTILLSVAVTGAQETPHVLIGASGGQAFGNLSLGSTVEIEVPIARHFEMDARDTFSPLEEHVRLGNGYDNVATIEPVIWLTRGFGLDTRVDWSQYRVTKVSKHSAYVFAGIATRGLWYGSPARMSLDYFREARNGIYGHGIETSHLQGGSLYLEAQVWCSRRFCSYTTLEMSIGGLLEQGNPVCDGSGVANPQRLPACPRTRNVSGSGIMGFLVELGRH